MVRFFSKSLFIGAILFNSILWAEDTCYSVQLASFHNKNSIYFNDKLYPASCKVISLTNLKAIRCGCIDDRSEAVVSLKSYRKKYHGAILVRTYKSRFQRKLDIATEKRQTNEEDALFKAPTVEIVPKKDPVKVAEVSQNETAQTEVSQDKSLESEKEHNIFDKKIKSFFKEGDLSIQGHFDITTQAYLQRPPNKHKANLTISGEIEADYIYNDITVVAKLYAQADSFDAYDEASQKNGRSFVRIDELFLKQDFEDDQIMFGKNVRFWGSLETRNITDVFNPTDLRSDIFQTDKLGVWNIAYTHYTETGDLSLIVKLQEQNRRLSYQPYVYYVLPGTVDVPLVGDVPLNYDYKLQADQDVYRPSFFMKYAGSTDTEFAWDYAVIFENGYDSQRYFLAPVLSDSNTSFDTQENAYLVNKIMSYNTIVIGSTLIKVEAVYANVISDEVISDYYHVGLGLEHTLIQFYGDADLGLIAEYFKYETLEDDPSKYDDLRLFETFQNDLFLGARYSFNQGNDASIIGGGIFDLEYDEQVYYIEYESRIADTFKLNLDYRYINPSTTEKTAFSVIGTHQRISAKIGYYF